MAVENGAAFRSYVNKLSEVYGLDIVNFDDYYAAISKRHDYFQSVGCTLADHGIDNFFSESYSDDEISEIFNKVYIKEEDLTNGDTEI